MDTAQSKLARVFLVSWPVLLLAACAGQVINRPYDVTKPTSLAIDAKQRVVLSGAARPIAEGDSRMAFAVVCAEPSPDALSALSNSLSLSGSYKDKVSLATSLASVESAGSIGLRTQSIQLMRDAMYRLCEGYMSGAIDASAFETLHRRFQSSMVAILAIEQLTGAVRAPTVVLGGSSSSGDPEQVVKITQDTETKRQLMLQAQQAVEAAKGADKTAQDELKAASDAQAALEKEGKPVPNDVKDRVTKAKGVVEKTEAAAKDADAKYQQSKGVYESYEAGRLAAVAGGSSASSNGKIETFIQGTQLNADSAKAIAGAVSDIVENTLNLSFGRELCTTVLLKESRSIGDLGIESSEQRIAFLEKQQITLKRRMELQAVETRLKGPTKDTISGLQADLANAKKALSDAEADEDKARSVMMRKSSLVSSCLLYLDSSSMALATDQGTQRVLAEVQLVNAQVNLEHVRALKAVLDDPKAPADKKTSARKQLDNIVPSQLPPAQGSTIQPMHKGPPFLSKTE